MTGLDPLLHRQLSMLGLDERNDDPPPPEAWATVLTWVSEHYRQMAEERTLLKRSYEDEIRELHRGLALDRERLQQLSAAVTAALAILDDALDAGGFRPTLPASLRAVLEDMAEGGDVDLGAVRRRFEQLGDRICQRLAATGDEDAMRDLERAGELQRAWLPPDRPIRHGLLEVAGFCRNTGPCGGDWWALRRLDARRVLVVIGDATGHGADAALVTGVARGALDVAVRTLHPGTPSAVLEAMNGAIAGAGIGRVQMTCSAAIVDTECGTITISSAGHPLPIALHIDGTVKQLRATGNPLGASLDSHFEDTTARLSPGDALVWYTDGLIELENPAGQQFGARRLRRLLTGAHSIDPRALRDAIARTLTEFASGAPAVDDVAFAVARFAAG